MEILVSVSGTLEICFTGQSSLYAVSALGASLELPELLFGVDLFVGVFWVGFALLCRTWFGGLCCSAVVPTAFLFQDKVHLSCSLKACCKLSYMFVQNLSCRFARTINLI